MPNLRAAALLAIYGLAVSGAAAQTMPPKYPGKLTTLYPFVIRSRSGSTPVGGLVLGDDGNFYGTTSQAGDTICNCGTIFRITPDGQLTTLHTFSAPMSSQFIYPRATLAKGPNGYLYGTAWSTGIGAGVAFRISTAGDYSELARLPGSFPSGLILASDGNFYGTTRASPRGDGGFFRLTPSGEATLLRELSLAKENLGYPSAVIQGRDGNFYATNLAGVPSFLRITPDGALTVLGKDFAGLGRPISSVVEALPGIFYGVAEEGVYQITASGLATKVIRFTEKGLYSERGSTYNDDRFALTMSASGDLYGMNGDRAPWLFRVSTSGDFQVIYRAPSQLPPTKVGDPYINDPEGSMPSMLVQGPDGFYGTMSMQGPVSGAGGTVFKITFDGGGLPASPPPPPPPPAAAGPIEAVDPNTENLRPSFLQWEQGSYAAFAAYPDTVIGIAADGVTPVVLRWRMPKGGKVTFSLSEESGLPTTPDRVGALGCVYSTGCAQAGGTDYPGDVQQIAGSAYAFVRLTSPLDFTRQDVGEDLTSARRAIRITATLAADDGSTIVKDTLLFITRTPIVLLHGIWSNEHTWDDWPLTKASLYILWNENYEDTNSARFAVNITHPRNGVRKALGLMRANRIAVTQADFIGHSMGGLLARLYIGQFQGFAYYRDENLGLGDIHKLITVDTPHWGSELANCAVDDAGNITSYGSVAEVAVGCVTCGAVSDLRVGSSLILNMPNTDLPSHAIIGVGGTTALSRLDDFTAAAAQLPGWFGGLGKLARAGVVGTELTLRDIFGAQRHDLIVSESSQTGGLGGDAITTFDAELTDWAVHTTVTHDSRINNRVIELLNLPAGSSWFGRFPAGSAAAVTSFACPI